jgi:hypothetical protein
MPEMRIYKEEIFGPVLSVVLSGAPNGDEPEQPALLIPVEGDRTAEPVDGHVRRLPVGENGGNEIGGKEAKP